MIYTTAADCITAAAQAFGIEPKAITGPKRVEHIVVARFAAAHLARTLTGQSLPELGARFGGRDHTTMLNAIRRAEQMMAEDLGFATRYQAARKALPQGTGLQGRDGEFHRHGSLQPAFQRATAMAA